MDIYQLIESRPAELECLLVPDPQPTMTDGIDYTLANPDTLTKYKEAGQISQRVLKAVAGVCSAWRATC
jgi:hypothetical protein